ncbi:MAG: AMP-binding protein [Chthoniobacter sp.]|nr:AMP-binding protein [Chthoniobacter sp.]
MDEYLALENRLASLIDSGAVDEAAFREAALAVHRFQRQHNEPLANYCVHRDTPLEIQDWREIPAVPQSVFKRFRLSVVPPEAVTTTFLTSGTTGEARGQHHFLNTRLYDRAIIRGWERLALPAWKTLILTLPPADAPHSSLSHMFGVLAARGSARFCMTGEGRLDLDAISGELATGAPVAFLGTALAFLNLFEQLGDRRWSLAPGSFALETGGYKGSGRDIPKPDLYALFGKHLGLPPDQIFNEYGMTELSSQCYTRGLNRPHEAPPWMRALVIDPETGKEMPIGETGILQLFDLANLGSSLAIETQDLAVREETGFTLLGRDPGALPRGCSRAADEALRNYQTSRMP